MISDLDVFVVKYDATSPDGQTELPVHRDNGLLTFSLTPNPNPDPDPKPNPKPTPDPNPDPNPNPNPHSNQVCSPSLSYSTHPPTSRKAAPTLNVIPHRHL